MTSFTKDKSRQRIVTARKRPGAAPTVRISTFADYGGVAALLGRNGLPIRPREDWITYWKGNPAFEQRHGDWPIGWVLEDQDGEIVGSISNVPLAMQFSGRPVRAAAACSWAVDPIYRGYALQIFNEWMRQKHVDLGMSTTVSAASHTAYEAFRWARVPAGDWSKAEFWITNHRSLIRSLLTAKAVPLAGAWSWLACAGLAGVDRCRSYSLGRIASTAEIGWSTDFGDRFDEFWSELQHQGCQVLLADRSRETLAWHFRIGLARRSVWILTATRRSRLVAYGVFDRLDHQKLGFTRIRFVDFQALRGEEELLRVFLASALERCRKERIDMLEITGGWLRRESLPAIAPPHGRALGSWTYYYKPSEEFRAALTGPAAWAPTSYDGDASL